MTKWPLEKLKHHKVEEYLIKESHGKWVHSHYMYHGSFDTHEEAQALLDKLQQRPKGYTHYRITT